MPFSSTLPRLAGAAIGTLAAACSMQTPPPETTPPPATDPANEH